MFRLCGRLSCAASTAAGGGSTSAKVDIRPDIDTSAAPSAETAPVEIIHDTRMLEPQVSKLIYDPINYTRFERWDEHTAIASAQVSNVASVAWLYPARYLQFMVHSRFEVEVVAECKVTKEPLGILSVTAAHFVPDYRAGSIVSKMLNRPHNTLAIRAMVVDRQQWRRSAWSLAQMNTSFGWGTLVKRLFVAPTLFSGQVDISASLNCPEDEREQRRKANGGVDFRCKCPLFEMDIDEMPGAPELVSTHSVTTPCFTDNESALSTLGMPREVHTLGAGGTVTRQAYRAPLVNPTLGKLVRFEANPEGESLLRDIMPGPLPQHEPLAVWLVDNLGECVFYEAETHVENDNDPHYGLTQRGGPGALLRVTHRGKMRGLRFRDGIRKKWYNAVADNK